MEQRNIVQNCIINRMLFNLIKCIETTKYSDNINKLSLQMSETIKLSFLYEKIKLADTMIKENYEKHRNISCMIKRYIFILIINS